MIKHKLIQGSPEWVAFRLEHDGASEAAAMLGLSRKNTRNELLHMKHTGMSKEFSEFVQRNILDKGHKVEALARPLIEEAIGDDLYPVTCSNGRLSASCDGLTMGVEGGEIAFEHKQWNAEHSEMVRNNIMPEEHIPQCQQIMLVTGAQKVVFTVSDGTPDNLVRMDVLPDDAWFERIERGWEQFHKDLAAYVPVDIAEMPRAEVKIELPALFVHAKGEITEHNMEAFGIALTNKLAEVRAIALLNDQDFSNAKEAAKKFRDTAKAIALSKEAMLAQTDTIGEAARKMDAWVKDLNGTALLLEKDVDREDLAKKRVMISDTATAYTAHIEALESETRPIQLNIPRPNFAEVIKGKRNYASMQGALDDVLANGKIEADAVAKHLRGKLAWYNETTGINNGCYGFLFADLDKIITKPMDDFKLLVTTRIDAHKKAEAAKIERIRAEEKAKAEVAAAEVFEAARIKAEQEAKAKAEAEIASKAKADAVIAYEAELEVGAKLLEDQAAAAIEDRRKRAQITEQSKTFNGAPAKLINPSDAEISEAMQVAFTATSYEATRIRPDDGEVIAVIMDEFSVSYGQACDYILEVAENLRVTP